MFFNGCSSLPIVERKEPRLNGLDLLLQLRILIYTPS